jgi:hypothetical protein
MVGSNAFLSTLMNDFSLFCGASVFAGCLSFDLAIATSGCCWHQARQKVLGGAILRYTQSVTTRRQNLTARVDSAIAVIRNFRQSTRFRAQRRVSHHTAHTCSTPPLVCTCLPAYPAELSPGRSCQIVPTLIRGAHVFPGRSVLAANRARLYPRPRVALQRRRLDRSVFLHRHTLLDPG